MGSRMPLSETFSGSLPVAEYIVDLVHFEFGPKMAGMAAGSRILSSRGPVYLSDMCISLSTPEHTYSDKIPILLMHLA